MRGFLDWQRDIWVSWEDDERERAPELYEECTGIYCVESTDLE